jgi:hypothetical protein
MHSAKRIALDKIKTDREMGGYGDAVAKSQG